jgi:hypothetical protein
MLGTPGCRLIHIHGVTLPEWQKSVRARRKRLPPSEGEDDESLRDRLTKGERSYGIV